MPDGPSPRDESNRSAVLKRAYSVIEEQQARIRDLERQVADRASAGREPLAIVGLSCRFPGASSPDAYWELLRDGIDAVSEVPPDRWNRDDLFDANPDAAGKTYSRHGGFLTGIDRFDPAFFGISPREAVAMDPQQRLLLETTWEALDRAGQPRDRLAASPTGVFIGITAAEYGRFSHSASGLSRLDSYHITGNTLNAAAGRLSYTLGFTGPAVAVDTACSSSLVAVHLACRAIWQGDCEQAVAGGVHLILSPAGHVALSRARVLSAQGRCRTFDAAADGMVRGEGCGVIVVRRLSDALRDGDPVMALIRGTAVNQDGPSSGLTVPNGPSQEEVIRAALRNAGVAPLRVGYVEAHGTATPLGDPIEINALAQVLCAGRPPDDPLLLGSVKTNVGHLEAAAGIAGLIKAVMALHHQEIPPHLHFAVPSPRIPWSEYSLLVVTSRRAWPRSERPRIAGVSAFGFSGTNAHVVLEEAPAVAAKVSSASPPYIFPLSARNERAIAALSAAYAAHAAEHLDQTVEAMCWTAQTGRGAWADRVAVVASDRAELVARLTAAARGERGRGIAAGRAAGRPRVGFVYSDAPFATLCEMTALWRSWGVEPWAVAGHGRGEYAAAVAAGVTDVAGAADMIARGEGTAALRSVRPRVRWIAGAVAPADAAAALSEQGCDQILHVGRDSRGQLIERAAALWTFGAPVNWRVMGDGKPPSKVVMPSYPWERQRYWLAHDDETAAPVSVADAWTYEIGWQDKAVAKPVFNSRNVAAHAAAQLDRVRSEASTQQYFDAVDAVEARVPHYVLAALTRMGMPAGALGRCTAAEFADQLQVAPAHRRQFARLLEIVSASGAGVYGDEGLDAASDKYAAAGIEIQMVDRCGRALADVLRGTEDPLPLLFPGDGTASAADLYSDSGASRIMNRVVADALETAVRDAGPRALKILELGAGTGGTTAAVLPRLPPQPGEYVFTDVSPAFLSHARERFQAYPFLRTARLDIETDPVVQGFTRAAYDMVIGANVVHATKNLRESLAHALSLVRPGGLLVLLEGTAPMATIDLIFGLTSGWWRFEDRDVRPEHPLPPVERWRALLREAGCDEVETIGSRTGDRSVLATQAVFVARKAPAARTDVRGSWLILGSGAGLGSQIRNEIGSRGCAAEVILASSALETRLDGAVRAGTVRGVVDVRALDAPRPDGLGSDAIRQHAEDLCAGTLELLRPLARHGFDCAVHLVTRDAVRVAEERLDGLVQAPLWGVGKVIALEHPELRTRLIDLDASSEPPCAALVDALLEDDGETQIAYRGGRRLVARLRPHARTSSRDAPRFSREAGHLITGGFGGLGLLVAEWLAANGAGLIALVGRRLPSVAVAQRIREIERHGTVVVARSADVADLQQLDDVLAVVRGTGRRLAAVFHAAGVLDDGILLQLDRERVANVMKSKVQGAWNLHTATLGDQLDAFVLFSAATSMLGSAGQGSHAAANAFLDSLAGYRHARGLPALSINWGAWSDAGAASGSDVVERVRTKGLQMIEPARGLEILGQLMTSGATQVGAFGVAWDRIPASMAALPLLSECVAAAKHRATEIRSADAPKSPQGPAILDRIHAAPPLGRRHLIEQHVRDEVRHVLGVPDGTRIDMKQGLFDLGMDSLTSMELRSRLQGSLGRSLPPTLAFDFPTPDALVTELARLLAPVADVDDVLASKLAELRAGSLA